MSLASADLPSDPDALRAFALACQNELAAATAELQAAKLAVQLRTLEIEKLKLQIAKLRRMQFGRSSERLARQIEQLELRLEELEAGEAEEISKAAAEDPPLPIREGDRPKRKPLPDHLPRHAIVHEPMHDEACTCPACGGDMARLNDIARPPGGVEPNSDQAGGAPMLASPPAVPGQPICSIRVTRDRRFHVERNLRRVSSEMMI
jgi:transposase